MALAAEPTFFETPNEFCDEHHETETSWLLQ